MLSTSLVVASLTSGQKIVLACVGGAFIVFSLVSALVLPRRSPNFPGRGLGWFVSACVLFLVVMLATVIAFGKEKKENANAAAPPAASSGGGTKSSSGPPAGGASQGNATAGKQVFATAGCTGCHTLKDANATGTVGPNLDQLKPSFALVRRQVTNGGAIMPPFKGKLTPQQIDDVAAYVSSVAGKS